MKIKMTSVSAIEKIFPHTAPKCVETQGRMLSNERYHFQVVIQAERSVYDLVMKVDSDIKENISCKTLHYVTAFDHESIHTPRDEYYCKEPFVYPDVVQEVGKSGIVLRKDINNIFFIEVYAKEGLPAGRHDIRFTLVIGKEEYVHTYTLEVLPQRLEESDLKITHWFHYDCICDYYRVEPFSDDFWGIMDKYVDEYIAQGNTVIYTPLFTPCLDTDVGEERRTVQLVRVQKEGERYAFDFSLLRTFIEFMQKKGIQFFELSHLFTQWGAEFCPKIIVQEHGKEVKAFGWNTSSTSEEYRGFLGQFLPKLVAFLEDMKMQGRVFFHLSDEPTEAHVERYASHKSFVSQYVKNYPIMDAMSEPTYAKLMDIPVATIDAAHKFDGISDNFWVYYACDQVNKNAPNIFIRMPALRTRVIGFILYRNGVKGLLHWGFNFWYSGRSREMLNPYYCNDCEGFFPAGDGFTVYPAIDGVNPSLRGKILSDAVEDYRLLKTVERKIGRAKLLAYLQKKGFEGYLQYPKSEEEYLTIRRELHGFM